jgi:hypothetical protein
MHKSASYSLLTSDGLQNRWRASAATSFIRRKNKFRFHYVYLVATILLVLIVYISLPSTSKKVLTGSYIDPSHFNAIPYTNYNSTYPLTRPIVNSHNHHTIYRIGIIADLDTNSKATASDSWSSYYKLGYLTVGPSLSTFEFKWDTEEPMKISSGYALKGKFYINFY